MTKIRQLEELALFKQQYLIQLKKELRELQERIYDLDNDAVRRDIGEIILKKRAKQKDFRGLTKEALDTVLKKCSKCGVEKSISDFHVCKGGKYGRHGACRLCTSLKRKKNLKQ